MKEQAKLREHLNQLEASDWIEPSRKLFLFSNRAKFWFSHGTTDEKRIILATIGSNLLLKDKKLSIDAKKPFRILSERASGSPLCTVVPGVRTFFETTDDSFIPLLKDPKEFCEKEPQAEDLAYEPVNQSQSWQGPTISY